MEKLSRFLSSTTTRFLIILTINLGVLGLGYLGITTIPKDTYAAAPLIQAIRFVLPVVKTSDQISVYTITNSGSSAASTLHSFYNGGYPGGTSVTSFPDTLAISETKTYSLNTINLSDGFVGDVVILSSQPLTGSVSILRPSITVTVKSDLEVAEIGQEVTYTYEVTNTSVFTFNLISGYDNVLGDIPFNNTILEPEHNTTGILTYTVVISDLAQPLINTVIVSGTVTGGSIVTATAVYAVTVQDNKRFNYLPVIWKK